MDAAKLLGLLGLARRAGRLAIGFRAVETLVRRGETPLVIAATDMGAAQRAKVGRLQPVRGVVSDVLTGAQMAEALGRDKLSVVAVADSGFVKGIARLRDEAAGAGAPDEDRSASH